VALSLDLNIPRERRFHLVLCLTKKDTDIFRAFVVSQERCPGKGHPHQHGRGEEERGREAQATSDEVEAGGR